MKKYLQIVLRRACQAGLAVLILGAITHQASARAPGAAAPGGAKKSQGAVHPLTVADQSAGFNPLARLLQAGNGTFYGTTAGETGDDGVSGAVFSMDSAGNVTVMDTFYGEEGMSPEGALVFGTDGYIYGTTEYGDYGWDGSDDFTGDGTIFVVSPNDIDATPTTLWVFDDGVDGANPGAALVSNTAGEFYGTTYSGGQYGDGVVFEFAPYTETLTTLWSFSGNADGAGPSTLIAGPNGVLYGITYSEGPGGFGTVYELAKSNTQWQLTTLAAFNGVDGAGPQDLFLGSDGNLYGVTTGGGPQGFGTIFEVTPAGLLTTLFIFDGVNGAEPTSLLEGSDGNIYGATEVGGSLGGGTFFKLKATGKIDTLQNFNPVKGELWDVGYLTEGLDHSFYGVDPIEGTVGGGGAVFSMTLKGKGVTVDDLANFTPPSTLISAAAVRATNVTEHGATLVGIVNPNGADTTVHFELGTEDTYLPGHHLSGATYSAYKDVGFGTKGISTKAKYTGLSPSTTYYFELYATNEDGSTLYSVGPQFSTPGPPTITYETPSVTTTTATITGDVNPRGHATTTYFEYGPSSSYGTDSPKVKIPTGVLPNPLSYTITGLSAGTEYHYRIVAKSSLGTVYGEDEDFVTSQ